MSGIKNQKANNVMVTKCELPRENYLIMENVTIAIIIFVKGALDVAGLQKS